MRKVDQRIISQKLQELFDSNSPQYSVSIAPKTDLDVPDLIDDKEYKTNEPLSQPSPASANGMGIKEDDSPPILPPKGKRTFIIEPPDEEQEVLNVKIVKGPEVNPNKKNVFKIKSEQQQMGADFTQNGTVPSPMTKPKKKEVKDPGDDDYLNIDQELGEKPQQEDKPIGKVNHPKFEELIGSKNEILPDEFNSNPSVDNEFDYNPLPKNQNINMDSGMGAQPDDQPLGTIPPEPNQDPYDIPQPIPPMNPNMGMQQPPVNQLSPTDSNMGVQPPQQMGGQPGIQAPVNPNMGMQQPPPMQPGMDPSMMGAQLPQQMGGQPGMGMDPSMMGQQGMGAQPGMDPSMMGGMGMPGSEPPKTPKEIGRIYELKKIYSRLISVDSYLSFTSDETLQKIRSYVLKATDIFKVLISNIDSFQQDQEQERLDDIIVVFYNFIEEVYVILRRYYDEKELEDKKNGGKKKSKVDKYIESPEDKLKDLEDSFEDVEFKAGDLK